MSPVTDGGSCFYTEVSKMPLMERCIQCQTIGSRFLVAWMDFLRDGSDVNLPQISSDICLEATLGGVQLDLRVQRLLP